MIIKMQKLTCLVAKSDAKAMLKALAREGCVELKSSEKFTSVPEYSGLLSTQKQQVNTDILTLLKSSLTTLSKYSPYKKSFLDPLPLMIESDFEDDASFSETVDIAGEINALSEQLSAADAAVIRLKTSLATIAPFNKIDLALEKDGGKFYSTVFGAVPIGIEEQTLQDELAKSGAAAIIPAGIANDMFYFVLCCLKKEEERHISALKPFGFTRLLFKDVTGTASQISAAINVEIAKAEKQHSRACEEIEKNGLYRTRIEAAVDLASTRLHRESTQILQACTKKTILLYGFTPSDCKERLVQLFEEYNCSFDFSVPTDKDDVPVALKNNALVRPFEMVTALYALPEYKSPVDPNPLVAAFFFLYFGLMMGDAAYGIIIALVSYFMLKKSRPREGTMKKLLGVGLLGGISTFIWGIMFGSYFGDFIPVVTKMFTGTAITPKPFLFDPLKEPLMLFGISLAFGVVQILLGMGLSMYQKVVMGNPLDAVLDEGLWLVIFTGFGLVGAEMFLDISMPTDNFGLFISLIGAVLIILTKGRNEKGIGKITAGLGELYGITGYLADLLSYSRLLALGLATAVIAQVMNTMGSLLGPSVIGVILLVVVFVIGHTFNVAINILGTFVHTSRLQFIEFFGKFYMPGGQAFKPFCNNTRYVEVLKEQSK